MSALNHYPNNLFNYKYVYIFILSVDNLLLILMIPTQYLMKHTEPEDDVAVEIKIKECF